MHYRQYKASSRSARRFDQLLRDYETAIRAEAADRLEFRIRSATPRTNAAPATTATTCSGFSSQAGCAQRLRSESKAFDLPAMTEYERAARSMEF